MAVKSTTSASKTVYDDGGQQVDVPTSPSNQSQGVALKAVIASKAPEQLNFKPQQQPLVPQNLLEERKKPHNVHRVSVSSSSGNNDSDSDDDLDDMESDPNRTGETSNISEESSYFTNAELSQSEGVENQ